MDGWTGNPIGQNRQRLRSAQSAGLKGFSLLARPLRKQYATLSVWTNEEALDDFARSQPHQELISQLLPQMAPTTFVRWTILGREGRPRLREALRRLDSATG